MSKTDVLYVAGPMTHRPHFNFDLFDDVATALRADGYEVVSPAELDDPEDRARAYASPDGAPVQYTYGKTHADFLARDLKIIADRIDAIVVLPEWETSTGARIETFVGHAYGKPILQIVEHEFAGLVLVPVSPLMLVPVSPLMLYRAWAQDRNLYLNYPAYGGVR